MGKLEWTTLGSRPFLGNRVEFRRLDADNPYTAGKCPEGCGHPITTYQYLCLTESDLPELITALATAFGEDEVRHAVEWEWLRRGLEQAGEAKKEIT